MPRRPNAEGALTIADARTALHAIGYTLSRRNAEYRVAPLSGSPAQREAQAYYTTDLADAVATAKAEVKRRTDAADDRSPTSPSFKALVERNFASRDETIRRILKNG